MSRWYVVYGELVSCIILVDPVDCWSSAAVWRPGSSVFTLVTVTVTVLIFKFCFYAFKNNEWLNSIRSHVFLAFASYERRL
jgi:hypothetical protein